MEVYCEKRQKQVKTGRTSFRPLDKRHVAINYGIYHLQRMLPIPIYYIELFKKVMVGIPLYTNSNTGVSWIKKLKWCVSLHL